MAIDDVDIMGIPILPGKANPPLIVDADRMLTGTIAGQGFEPVARWDAQIVLGTSIVEKTQLAQCDRLDFSWQPATSQSSPD